MLPEQQQRIMGYFIEEAKDHLNTIEQGLLNLQATISDAEMANEVFRAAHSVKGGAAMLGLDSIQTTAHRMEDYFKILKESPVQVDRALETMFLQVFDGLQDLLDQLQGPFGLSDDKAQEIMAGVEPVFGQISTHLDQLVADGGATPESVSSQPVAATGSAVKGRPDQVLVGQAGEQSALVLMFKSNVPGHLRDMLNLFKQGDTDQTRQQLQDLCDTLRRIGEQFDLEAWCDLAKSAQVAIANPENGYRALAPIVITDLKAGQDLVSAGREPEVSISDRLQAMLPEDALELDSSSELDALLEEATDGLADDGTLADPDLESLFGADGVGESEEFDLGDLSDLDDGQNAEAAVSPEAASETNGSSGDDDFDALFGDTDLSALDEPEAGSMPAAKTGPEVGSAELNSLADLFEGESSEFGENWQEEAISGQGKSLADSANGLDMDITSDFSDLLETSDEASASDADDELADLFGDNLLDMDDDDAEPSIDPEPELADLGAEGAESAQALEAEMPDLSFDNVDAQSAEAAASADNELADLFGDDLLDMDGDNAEPSTDLDSELTDLGAEDTPALETEIPDLPIDHVEAQSVEASASDDDDELTDLFEGDLLDLDDDSDLSTAPDLSTDLDSSTPEPAGLGAEEAQALETELPDLAIDNAEAQPEQDSDVSDFDDFFAEPETVAESNRSTQATQEIDDLFAIAPETPSAESPQASEIELDDLLSDAATSPSAEANAEELSADALFSLDQPQSGESSLDDLSLGEADNESSDAGLDELDLAVDSTPLDVEPVDEQPEAIAASAEPVETEGFDMEGMFAGGDIAELEGDEQTNDGETLDLDSPDNLDDLDELNELQVEPSNEAPTAETPSDPNDALGLDTLDDLNFDDDEGAIAPEPNLDDLEDALETDTAQSAATEDSVELDFGELDLETPVDIPDASMADASGDSDSPSSSDLEAETPLTFDELSFDETVTESETDFSGNAGAEDLDLGDLADNLNFDSEDSSSEASAEDLDLGDLTDSLNFDSEDSSSEAGSDVGTEDLDLGDLTDNLNFDSEDSSSEASSDVGTEDLGLDDLADSLNFDSEDSAEAATDADEISFDDLDLADGDTSADIDDQAGETAAVDETADTMDLLFSDLESDEPSVDDGADIDIDLDLDLELPETDDTGAESEVDADAGIPFPESALDDLLEPADSPETDISSQSSTAVQPNSTEVDIAEESLSFDEDFLGELGENLDEAALTLDESLESLTTDTPESSELPTDTESVVADLDLDLGDFNLDENVDEPVAAENTSDFQGLDNLLADEGDPWDDSPASVESGSAQPVDNLSGIGDDPKAAVDFDDLDSLLGDDPGGEENTGVVDEEVEDFDDLEALLDEQPAPIDPAGGSEATAAAIDDPLSDFDDLDALLDEPSDQGSLDAPGSIGADLESEDTDETDDDFDDLERLLEDADQSLGGGGQGPAIRRAAPATGRRAARRGGSGSLGDQTMRVSVKHLDNLSNLVGELVVNRNTLEQDQERLRQFLDNLLFQVQQLNDVGQRMRDLYERSLLESSLMSSRRAYQMAGVGSEAKGAIAATDDNHSTGATFDALEMDRFTGFHTLSQEMIELIVRVRESSSDIAYTIESSDQVTRQFRQVTTQLQEGLNKARMVPFAQTADRLPRAVRDISMKFGKEARLVVEGRDTLIDKMILEQLYDPMTHLVNNAITHGIETPEERLAAGKPQEGTITIRAFYQGNQTVIYVADDGAGINHNVVKRKAMQKGLITQKEARNMATHEVYELLFHPGFSTRDQADDFAGRGVGMDVVRTYLAQIRGTITTDSAIGKGTSFTIRLPLTLSISKALSCVSNQARIAFPMDGVEDMLDVPQDRIQVNDRDQSCILWRDTLLPFQPLSDLLTFNRTLGRGRVYGGNQDDEIVSIVVLRSANTNIALKVDQVIGEQEIVIKQLEGPVPKPTGIAGATVLGDGRVMPIADVLELIDISMGRVRREPTSTLWAQPETEQPDEVAVPAKSEPTVLIVDDSITVRELLSMSFNKVGYRVEQARDGQEAWEKLRSGLPCDLVFCDIEMPRMDGLELLSRMQKDSGLGQVPIAMLTSRGADRHRQMAVDLGASGYFTKPYLEEALLDAAQRMLNGEVLVGNKKTGAPETNGK